MNPDYLWSPEVPGTLVNTQLSVKPNHINFSACTASNATDQRLTLVVSRAVPIKSSGGPRMANLVIWKCPSRGFECFSGLSVNQEECMQPPQASEEPLEANGAHW